jgi:hypothetical protein
MTIEPTGETTMSSNLPNWPGADSVYAKVSAILKEMGAREYKAFCARKKPRKSDRFAPSETMDTIIAAMNMGDEEALKAAQYAYRDLIS